MRGSMLNAVGLNPVVLMLSSALLVVWSYYCWCIFGRCIKHYLRSLLQVMWETQGKIP